MIEYSMSLFLKIRASGDQVLAQCPVDITCVRVILLFILLLETAGLGDHQLYSFNDWLYDALTD